MEKQTENTAKSCKNILKLAHRKTLEKTANKLKRSLSSHLNRDLTKAVSKAMNVRELRAFMQCNALAICSNEIKMDTAAEEILLTQREFCKSE